MKRINWFSSLFGLMGTILAVGTVCISLWARNAEPVLLSAPKAAVERLETVLDAVCRGDYETAGSLIQGNPDLGVDRQPTDAVGVLLWDAFADSMAYSMKGTCYATDSGVAQDVEFTSLNISAVTGALGQEAQTLLAQRVECAEGPEQVYDENGEYRADFAMEVLLDAAEQILLKEPEYTTQTVTLHLVYEQGQWWVVPDAALLAAISGGITG